MTHSNCTYFISKTFLGDQFPNLSILLFFEIFFQKIFSTLPFRAKKSDLNKSHIFFKVVKNLNLLFRMFQSKEVTKSNIPVIEYQISSRDRPSDLSRDDI